MLRRMTVMLLCVLLALCAAGCGGVPEEKLARAGEDCTALVEEYNALAKTLGESALAADEDYTAALDELRTAVEGAREALASLSQKGSGTDVDAYLTEIAGLREDVAAENARVEEAITLLETQAVLPEEELMETEFVSALLEGSYVYRPDSSGVGVTTYEFDGVGGGSMQVDDGEPVPLEYQLLLRHGAYVLYVSSNGIMTVYSLEFDGQSILLTDQSLVSYELAKQ